MRCLQSLAFVAVCCVPAALPGQAIISQNSGLTNPDHVIDFGASLFPNWTPITNQFTGITVSHCAYFTTGTYLNLSGGFLTNYNIGQPNTLSIAFASQITDLTFVYHQVGTQQASVFRAMLGGAPVSTFSCFWNQTQPNNYFGFTGIVFDELQIDFDSDFNLDTLAYNDSGASCTFRNGSGINPPDFTFTSLPVLGQNWQCQVAGNVNTVVSYVAFAFGGAAAPSPLLNGELLVAVTPGPILIAGGPSFVFPVPNSAGLQGFQFSTQGVRLQLVGPTATLELLNALDLRLDY